MSLTGPQQVGNFPESNFPSMGKLRGNVSNGFRALKVSWLNKKRS